MPTRPAESTHEAEPNHPDAERNAGAPDERSTHVGAEAAGVESPGANSLPRDTNADDIDVGDQDIDTAGTFADDLSPTKSL
jgi:hypothetical protein